MCDERKQECSRGAAVAALDRHGRGGRGDISHNFSKKFHFTHPSKVDSFRFESFSISLLQHREQQH